VYDNGQMLLHLVVSSPTVNSDGLFRTVLEQNPATVSVGDMYGQWPLHLAAINVAGLEVVSVLLQSHKAATSAATKDGLLPIHMATGIKGSKNKDLGWLEIFSALLIAYPASINIRMGNAGRATCPFDGDGDLPFSLAKAELHEQYTNMDIDEDSYHQQLDRLKQMEEDAHRTCAEKLWSTISESYPEDKLIAIITALRKSSSQSKSELCFWPDAIDLKVSAKVILQGMVVDKLTGGTLKIEITAPSDCSCNLCSGKLNSWY
jgi:ankyrin repeat protein